MDDDDLPRRAARADLHVLPPGARARRAGRADAAHARRADDRRDRARVPRPRADDGAAAGARQAEDQARPAIPFRVPPDHLLPDRLAAVLAVVYLDLQRGLRAAGGDLAAEAIRLGRALAELMPDEPEAHGLLALMLLHDARRDARLRATASSCCSTTRTARSGTATRSTRGARVLDRALALQRPRPVRAAGGDRVAAHGGPARLAARSPRSTASSRALTGSPVVELNRAVAVAEADGARGGPRDRSTRLDARRLPLPPLGARRAPAPARTATTRRGARTSARSPSRPTAPSAASSSGGSTSSNHQDRAGARPHPRLPPAAAGGGRRAPRRVDIRARPVLRLDPDRL